MRNVGQFFKDAVLGDPNNRSLDRPQTLDLQGALDQHSGFQPWNQKRINEWQEKIFGLDRVNILAPEGVMDKIEEEVDELRKALEEHAQDPTHQNWEKVLKEFADVHVTLVHGCGALGVVLQEQVDRKMDINERRQWSVNASGSGKHVE